MMEDWKNLSQYSPSKVVDTFTPKSSDTTYE